MLRTIPVPPRLVAAIVLRVDAEGIPAAVLLRRSGTLGIVYDLPGGRLDPGEFPSRGARRWIAMATPRNLLLIPRLAWYWTETVPLCDGPGDYGFILTTRAGPETARGLESDGRGTGTLLWGELADARHWLGLCPPALMGCLLPALTGRGRGHQVGERPMPVAALWPAETVAAPIVATETTGVSKWLTEAIAQD